MTDPKTIFNTISAGKVLDVASGKGSFVRYLTETLKDYDEITAIDLDDNRSTFEAAFKDKKVRFIEMDAHRMKFADAIFDTVCLAYSLHHLVDPALALAEMARVLKPGGLMVIVEMYSDGQTETQLTHVLLHHWWAAVDTARGITHHETFNRQQIIDMVNPLGLKDLSITDYCDLSDNPKDPQTVASLESIIDRYIQRAADAPDQTELEQRGEMLRKRLYETGFDGATDLIITGRKP